MTTTVLVCRHYSRRSACDIYIMYICNAPDLTFNAYKTFSCVDTGHKAGLMPCCARCRRWRWAVEVAERSELALASPQAADGEPGLGGSARRSTSMLPECNAPRS
eukprot:COSAG06_NODE_1602_length_8958_cov_85.920194_8_plen_105_part_00